jgi:hypothetical protein
MCSLPIPSNPLSSRALYTLKADHPVPAGAVGIATDWAGWLRGRSLSPGRVKNFHCSMLSRLAVRSTQWVPGVFSSVNEADHSPPVSAEAKETRVYTSTNHTSSWRSALQLYLTLQADTGQSSWLTAWSWALIEKPHFLQLLKNFPALYGTKRFITVFTGTFHWSLFWARSIQSIPPHPVSLRAILILTTHLRLGLPSGRFPSGAPIHQVKT